MKPKRKITDPDIIGARTAMLRAAEAARRIAAETGTPLILWENGRIVEKHVKPGKDR